MKFSLSKAPLPGPRSAFDFDPNDESLTDLQLFRKYCMPLGDTWPEAWSETPMRLKRVILSQVYSTNLNLACCENIIYSSNLNDGSHIYIHIYILKEWFFSTRPIMPPCRPNCSQSQNTLDAAST